MKNIKRLKPLFLLTVTVLMTLCLSTALVACDEKNENSDPIQDDTPPIISDEEKLSMFNYYIENGKIRITGLKSYSSDIVIPDCVTSIEESAFSYCEDITNITFPDNLAFIGHDAFAETAWLKNQPNGIVYAGNVVYTYKGEMNAETSITLKESTTGISDFAFKDCKKLTSIKIPNGTITIGDFAFENCTELSQIDFPDSITHIGGGALHDTAWFNNQPDGIVYVGKVAYSYKGDKLSVQSIDLREDTIAIADVAFCGCMYLTDIEIPNHVVHIGDWAFGFCSLLNSITIPNSVISIGQKTFYDCFSLKSLNIPDSVQSIADTAFYLCSGLSNITVSPNNSRYKSINNCIIDTQNKKLVLGCKNSLIPSNGSVTSIGDYAFGGCIDLMSIIIPDTITYIGDSAFRYCCNLLDVTIPNGVEHIGSSAFQECLELKHVLLPDSLTTIGSWAFYKCSNLTNISIPKGVTKIGWYVFLECKKLERINFDGTKKEFKYALEGEFWDLGTWNFAVHCTDGNIDKNGNDIIEQTQD